MKQTYNILLLITLILSASCAVDNDTDTPGIPTPEPDQHSIRLQLPSSLIIMPATRAIATQEENAISQLDIYIFDSNDTLEKIIINATISSGNYIDIPTSTGMQHYSFYLVANPQHISALNNVTVGHTMLSAFRELATDMLTEPVSVPLLMTGYTENIDISKTRNINVNMKRRITKLEVDNSPARTGVTIKQVLVTNTIPSTHLFDNGSAELTAIPTTIKYDYDANHPASFIQATGTTQVVIEVEEKGTTGTYLLPFGRFTLRPNLYQPLRVPDYGTHAGSKVVELSKTSASDYRTNIPTTWSAADYSGITWIDDNRYAVITDKKDGFYIMELNVTESGITVISRSTFYGDETTTRDCEGIIYHPKRGTLFISGEKDQLISEYRLDGTKTGAELSIPDMFAKSKGTGNYGFEALAYSRETGLFWTTTESTLQRDGGPATSNSTYNLHRLQAFDENLQPVAQYAYKSDNPIAYSTDTYAFGISEITALPDGRLLIMEREFPAKSLKTIIKIFLVDTTGATDVSKIPDIRNANYLPKTKMCEITTTGFGIANYEGMCLGPVLNDGTRSLILINDSQSRDNIFLKEYLKMIKLSYQ